MLMSRRGSGRALSALKVECLIGALVAASFALSGAQAATFGHSRIVSGVGQPLHVEIPVTELTDQEIQSLRAWPAPAQAWRDAGMTPPVALDSMRLALLDGYRPGVKVVQLRSELPIDQPIVDVLIDVQSASGQHRYQVSLVASADKAAVRLPEEGARGARSLDDRPLHSGVAGQPAAGRKIRVRAGDTMFAIAERNAVPGVTVYQMMMGLQRANPRAFIENNVNLVKAGAVLTMPDIDTLKALSDREARRLFLQHVQAFGEYRRRGDSLAAAAVSTAGEAVAQGQLSQAPADTANAAVATSAPEDRLRLSAGSPPSGQGGQAGSGAPINMLASSGAIASDAVTDRGPHAAFADGGNGQGAGFSSGVVANGTVLQADGATTADADDEAALRKGVEDSRVRIIELEDNVRHLNEALQKQGHVAAETAMEGMRSVGEVIKEIINLVDPELADTPQAGGTGSDATGPAGATDAIGAADSSSTPGASSSTPGASSSTPGASSSTPGVSSSPSDASSSIAGASPVAGTSTTANGNAQQGTRPDAQPGALADTPGRSDAGAGDAAAGASGADTGNAGAGTEANTAAGMTGSLSSSAAGGASTSAAAGSSPGGQAAPDSGLHTTKVEKEVSWFQENMLAVIGGGLALVVLLVVWLLRRAGASNDDAFESDSPITDTMVREKLREIDLDLDSAPGGTGRTPR